MADSHTSALSGELGPPSSSPNRLMGWSRSSKSKRQSSGSAPKRSFSGGLSKLRNRLQALRDESGGSFSSCGSAAGGFGSPIVSEAALADADPVPPSPTSSWRISAHGSAEKTPKPAASPPPPLALPAEPVPAVAPIPSPKPPRPSLLDASPGPRTSPRRPAAPSPLRPRSPAHSLPVSAIGCDEQLGALDRLCKQLSQVAAALEPVDDDEEDVDSKAPAPPEVERSKGSQTLRSSTDHWKEYHDLAAQLELAQELLKQLEESDA